MIAFYHLWKVGGWAEIHQDLMGRMVDSRMADELRYFWIGNSPDYQAPPLHGIEYARTEVVVNNLGAVTSEVATLARMQEYCRTEPDVREDEPVFYFHCKGGKWLGGREWEPVRDWTKMMAHFCIDQWRDALCELERPGIKAVGVNRHTFPAEHEGSGEPPHFSGNFWWSTAGVIAGLPDMGIDRMDTEKWIGNVGLDAMGSLHQSPMCEGDSSTPYGMSHYIQSYPETMYVYA